MRTWLLVLLIVEMERCGRGDDSVLAPSPSPTRTGTILPFLLKQMRSPSVPTMRYQQVYNASLFTNADPASIYVTTLTFNVYQGGYVVSPWLVRSMQINLSTTSKSSDGLSSVFAENVGPDDTTVLAPAEYYFNSEAQRVLFDRPFKYNPALGNLLLDVRIFDGSGPIDPFHPLAFQAAYTSSTDEVSRLWATNVTAALADAADSTGLSTVIQLSSVPSLRAEFFPLYAGYFTNIVRIIWPSQPSTFVLQRTDRLGPNAVWGPVTNQIEGDPAWPNRWIKFPADSAGKMGYYRLVWPSGQ